MKCVARKNSPCIIFIDEIDAIGAKRTTSDMAGRNMSLNQLLVELDGFKGTEGVILIGATNFPEMLDSALIRPGRFDRIVAVPLPDLKGRQDILDLYLKDVPHDMSVDLKALARGTAGVSGADLANIVNVAAIQAASLGAEMVLDCHLDYAKDRVLMGAERKSAVIPDSVKKVTGICYELYLMSINDS